MGEIENQLKRARKSASAAKSYAFKSDMAAKAVSTAATALESRVTEAADAIIAELADDPERMAEALAGMQRGLAVSASNIARYIKGAVADHKAMLARQ